MTVRIYGDYGNYYQSEDLPDYSPRLVPKVPFEKFLPHKQSILQRLEDGEHVLAVAQSYGFSELSLRAFLVHLRLTSEG